MNHILKPTYDWQVQKTPDLVEKIYKIVELQHADVKHTLMEWEII